MSTALASPVASVASPQAEADTTFTIAGLSWDQYVAIHDALGDRSDVRTLFLDGRLTFMSPARVHEWSEDAIDSIIKAIAIGCRIEYEVVGSTTLRRGANLAGLEGDRAYYLRGNAERMSGPVAIDLAQNPPPDLAIEVENTNQAVDAMAIYARLGVPEVWRHDIRRAILGFWALQPDGTYQMISRSLGVPFLTAEEVLHQVRLAEEMGSLVRWSLQLADWVRDVIRPRLDPA